jgi:hypothetical protein
MNMITLQDATHPIENVDELLSNAFGRPTPPKEEILRHKWLESEKAGRDIGLLAAAHDWGAKHYPHWKAAHAHAPDEAPARIANPLSASDQRAHFLSRYVLAPLAAFWIISSLVQWATGFDCTDVIPTEWVAPQTAEADGAF